MYGILNSRINTKILTFSLSVFTFLLLLLPLFFLSSPLSSISFSPCLYFLIELGSILTIGIRAVQSQTSFLFLPLLDSKFFPFFFSLCFNSHGQELEVSSSQTFGKQKFQIREHIQERIEQTHQTLETGPVIGITGSRIRHCHCCR